MPPTRGTTSVAAGTATFTAKIRIADVALKGYSIKFDNNKDHHFGQLDVFFKEQQINNNNYSFAVFVLLRDFSGNIDDTYSGSVDVLVIADLEEPSLSNTVSAINRLT